MRVVVTGAGGFIGAAASRQLVESGIEVWSLGRCADPRLRSIPCDLLDEGAVRDALESIRPSHLLHLAWNAVPGVFWTTPDNLDWVAASLKLLRAFAAAGGKRWVGAGSCAEYDWTADSCLAELTTPLNPATLYGEAKAATGRLALAAGSELGLQTAWARIFWLYGPGERPGRLVSDLMRALTAGVPFKASAGLQRRDFLHVEDVAAALNATLLSDFQGAVNIASGEAIAVRDVVSLVAKEMGKTDLVRFGVRPSVQTEPPVLFGSTDFLRNSIGFHPKYSLEQGLKLLIETSLT